MTNMTYKKNMIFIVIGVMVLLGAVGIITYAYFSGNINLTSGSLGVNANIGQLNYYFEATGGNDIVLDVTYANMQAQNQGNVASTNQTSINISFTSGKEDVNMYCTYDLKWVWDNADEEKNRYVKSSGAEMEYTVSGTSETHSFSEKQVNDYASDTLLYSGYIASSSLTPTEQVWQITANFYNLEIDQTNLSESSFKSKIKVDNVRCENGTLSSIAYGGFNNMILADNGGIATIEAKESPNFNEVSPTISSYIDTIFNGSTLSMRPTATYYYTYAESYTFNAEAGTYTLVSPQVCQYSSCYSLLVNKYVTSAYGLSSSALATSTNKENIYKIESTTSTNVKYYSSTKTPVYETFSRGMFSAQDNFGTSYYYRGNVDNNWVKFDGEENNDMYFRIIRINGDGTVRMIYTGTTAPSENQSVVMKKPGTQIGTISYNLLNNGNVGYRYTEGDLHGSIIPSNIKGEDDNPADYTVDKWYETNILTNSKYINAVSSNQVICNDRIGYADEHGTTPVYVAEGALTYYYPAVRLENHSSNIVPSLICGDEDDWFTVDGVGMGNESLQYPVGLITADEVVMAGGKHGSINDGYYLSTGENPYWTVSPYSSGDGASVFIISSDGNLIDDDVTNNYGVRPVLSIKPTVEVTGTGNWNDPYVVDGT